jgi:hypothetical protein
MTHALVYVRMATTGPDVVAVRPAASFDDAVRAAVSRAARTPGTGLDATEAFAVELAETGSAQLPYPGAGFVALWAAILPMGKPVPAFPPAPDTSVNEYEYPD